MTDLAVQFDDICLAQSRIRPYARKTPLLEDATLNRLTGGRLLFKFESLQVGGSFKYRGVLNAILSLNPETRKRGILGFSSGNHAVALATAARILSVPGTVLMPSDAPLAKRQRAAGQGAKVILYDRDKDDRELICSEIVDADGVTLIKPYDQAEVIAGQGTVGLEIAESVKEANASPEIVAVPCSGGGLAAGVAVSLTADLPRARVLTVEPEGFDDTRLSLETGCHQRNKCLSGSICDALLVPTPGQLTLPLLLARDARGVAVSESHVRFAVATLLQTFGIVVEPGGAIGAAAFLSGEVKLEGRTAVVICSGGNIDRPMLLDCLDEGGVA